MLRYRSVLGKRTLATVVFFLSFFHLLDLILPCPETLRRLDSFASHKTYRFSISDPAEMSLACGCAVALGCGLLNCPAVVGAAKPGGGCIAQC